MSKWRFWRGFFAILAIASLVMLVPGSPLHVANWLASSNLYGGRSASSWTDDLSSGDPVIRRKAAQAIGHIGSSARIAVPRLSSIMESDDDGLLRAEAALALGKMQPESFEAVPALTRALNDTDPAVRMNAALALRRTGKAALPAVPTLLKALADDRNESNADQFGCTIKVVVVLALGGATAGTPQCVPVLMGVLDGEFSHEMQRAAAQALGEIGPDARPAIPRLQKLLDSHNQELSEAAKIALERIGESNEMGAATRDKPPEVELPEDERAYLWSIEHHGNILGKHGFGPLAEAVKKADRDGILQALASGFSGGKWQAPKRVGLATDYATVERIQDAGLTQEAMSREGFVAALLDARKQFGPTPSVKFALMTLGPEARRDLASPWKGTAQLRLHGEKSPKAPAEVVIHLSFSTAQPTEEALAKPGWLRSATITQQSIAHAPRFLFQEVAKQRGLAVDGFYDSWTANFFATTPGGCYVTDFNRDGYLDVLITDANGRRLYSGRSGGQFEDVTVSHGLPEVFSSDGATAWVDIDGDGWEDLILHGRVLRNMEGNRFVDYTDRCNLQMPMRANGLIIADYDRDGLPDIYVTRPVPPGARSWLEGKGNDSVGNFLFRNTGKWQFEDVTNHSGASAGRQSSFTAAWLDANNDGWADIHVINEFGDGTLLVNRGDGTFSRHRMSDRPADFGSMGVAVGDINNDGNMDVYCADMYSKAGTRVIGNLAADAYPPEIMEKMRRFVAGSQLHVNKGGLKFEQVGKAMQVAGVGWAYGPCLADLNNDGWLDIYATAGFVSRERDEPDG